MINIKHANEGDNQILAQIFRVLFSEELKSEEKIRKNIKNGKMKYYLGFVDTRPIGAITLKFDKSECELKAIAVNEKGKGYGTELLSFAENVAKEDQCTKIWCTSLVQHGVKDFYLKHGWLLEKFIKDFYPGKDSCKFSKSLN